MSRKVIVGALTKQVAERSAKLRRTQDGRGQIDSPRGESIFATWSPKIFHEARFGAQTNSININLLHSYEGNNILACKVFPTDNIWNTPIDRVPRKTYEMR